MNCSDFKEQAGAYALGALSEDEASAMKAHLAEARAHEGCEAALARALRTTAALSSSLEPIRPREHVWRAIESRLDKPRARRAPARRREFAAWALVAVFGAALLFVNRERTRQVERADRTDRLLAEANGRLADAKAGLAERDRCMKELESMKEGALLKREAIALLENPSTKVVALSPVAGKTSRASAIFNLAERRAIIVSSSMPRQSDKDFELWVIRPGQDPIGAGFMHAAGGGVEVGEIDSALLGSAPDAFAVSIEPLGGQPKPTEVLVLGRVQG
jgi:anti-sigma-K factor RskA